MKTNERVYKMKGMLFRCSALVGRMPELKDCEGLEGLQKKKDHHNWDRYGIRFIYTFPCRLAFEERALRGLL